MTTLALYTADDAGCYVDSARGIYATDAIVDFVRDHGATITHDPNCEPYHQETCDESEFAGCEFADEYEDEADDYMNDNYLVDGHYWGRNEWSGAWGLWPDEQEGDL